MTSSRRISPGTWRAGADDAERFPYAVTPWAPSRLRPFFLSGIISGNRTWPEE
jgi:hypothetical protein